MTIKAPTISLATRTEDLPATLPLFPLTGALLLPRGRLPLNIFEPRYIAMTLDALSAGRLIGMVQPRNDDDTPTLYDIGCAGRIVSFSETDDERLLIVLEGVSRFRLGTEIATTRGYRRTTPAWEDFAADVSPREEKMAVSLREELIAGVKPYFKAQGIVANWDTIEDATPERLVTSLCSACQFMNSEKQALLESPNLTARAETLLTLIRMANGRSHGHAVTDILAADGQRH